MLIGNHLSASKGYAAMGKAALALDANTFAFFTRNPRGGKAKKSMKKMWKVFKFCEGARIWKDCCACAIYDEPLRCKRGCPFFFEGNAA